MQESSSVEMAAGPGYVESRPAVAGQIGWVDRALALQRQGRSQEAMAACERALQQDAGDVRAMLAKAFMLQCQGRADEAIQWHERALAHEPHTPLAHQSLGLLWAEKGDHGRAIEHYRRALELAPDDSHTYDHLGISLEALNRHEEAIEAYRKALLLDDGASRTWLHLANALRRAGRTAEAVARYQKALSLRPDWAECWNNMAIALQDAGQTDEAIEAYRKATQCDPQGAEYFNNLGLALQQAGRHAEALEAYGQALRLNDRLPEAHRNMADALKEEGDLPAALAHYRRALLLRPDYYTTWWNLSLAMLLAGRLREGFALHHWRRHPQVPIDTYPHHLRGPRWDGTPFDGKTLLLHCEQGFGDAIQFLRFLPQVKALGGQVVLEVPVGLLRLAVALKGPDRCVAFAEDHPPDEPYDLHASVMDLPALLGTTEATIPQGIPYLRAPEPLVRRWQERFDPQRFHVGLIWAGNPKHGNDHNRSCDAELMAMLGPVDGVWFWSLQKGPAAAQLERLRRHLPVEDVSESLTDFAETAAVMMHLDLVISVDTAAAHLAGALGRPVWLALPFAPDWRWMLNRDDSPWYPTMRLFRQPERGRWPEVFSAMARRLQQAVSEQRAAAEGSDS